ncbi:MAG: NAD(P)/FAD-dependent oxidoreductase [Terricaulis sp.]
MDVAVVGAGIAGCYSAYRLAGAGVGAIDIYEASDRVGGRLWSLPVEGAAPIELGGMFFSSLQSNVFGLLTRELRLPCTPVKWARDRLYLRGKHLGDKSFEEASAIPFNLEGVEAGRSAHAILAYVLGRIVPGFTELWPFESAAPSWKTYARLRAARHRGRPLHQCSFWNVLSHVVSNEAYQLLTATIGSAGFFRNANAFDTVWNLLQEIAPQDFYRVDAGYQALPERLLDAAGDDVSCHLRRRLIRVDREGAAFKLTFEAGHHAICIVASHVILALPPAALERVAFGNGVLDDPGAFARLRDSVNRVPACKLFMTFEEAWWANPSRDPAAVVASYTDLPMQQCYFFGVAADTPATMLAAFADDISSSFWRAMLSEPERRAEGASIELDCSAPIVQAALRQLHLLHEVAPPKPTRAVFVDWSREPFGAGWHAWAAGPRSWDARKQIRSPAKNLFVCGEAFAERHGWVEGALNSAEAVVQHFGVGRPPWVDGSYWCEQQQGEDAMTGQVSELLIALGESSALKRAYDRDPGGIMNAFGLSDDAQVAMRSNDLSLVKSAAGVRECAFIVAKPSN